MHQRKALKLTYTIQFLLLVATLITLGSCQSDKSGNLLQLESLTQDETEKVDELLQKVYQSFCYGNAEEPDWELMRSVFFEGALFVGEVPDGEVPKPQTIEDFISSWQHAIRNSNSPTIETTEKIIETKAVKRGELIYVDVVFQGAKANDPAPKKYGLDSLVLASVDGDWKVLSFVVQYESKL